MRNNKPIEDTMIKYSLRQDIMKMNTDQLNLVILAIKDRRTQISLEIRSQFIVGDDVWFDHKRGKVEGTIIKMNPKSVQVKTDIGVWNVSPSYLNK